ncbi:MAG: protein phosphatase 2C domain-containing protein [Gammaproteobacteria bacterium]|nr:protein phosphatase 2C domain-containing protein [Gammaproteobacteria bacterium]
MTEPDLFSIASGQATVFSASNPFKETPNEDCAALIPVNDNSCVLVVADGVGGMPAGKAASSLAVDAVRNAVKKAVTENLDLREVILNGIEKANLDVMAQSGGSATTLAVVEIQNNVIRPYHVGDSDILVVGQRGKIKLQTVPHSPVGYAVEAGIMDEKEAIHHEERHIVSNVLGFKDMRIEVGSPVALSTHDTVFIGTDGVADNLFIDEIIECIRKGDLPEVADKLLKKVQHRMNNNEGSRPCKPDDHTFIVYRNKK